MGFKVLLHPRAVDSLNKLELPDKQRIKKKLEVLENRPRAGKRLKYSNFWSLRIGDYRAIYEINHEKSEAIVLFVGHRKNVYDDFSKLL